MASHIFSGIASLLMLFISLVLSPQLLQASPVLCDPVLCKPVPCKPIPCKPMTRNPAAKTRPLLMTKPPTSIGDQLIHLAADPLADPQRITVLQLLQTIDAHPRYMVILPSGKSIDKLQLKKSAVKTLHIFDPQRWKSVPMARRMLRSLGWKIVEAKTSADLSVTTDPRSATPVRRTRAAAKSIQILLAHPPEPDAEPPLITQVIPMKHANLDDTYKALRGMRGVKAASDDYFEVIAAPASHSLVFISSSPQLIEHCKILIDQMEAVAIAQQAKSSLVQSPVKIRPLKKHPRPRKERSRR